MTNIPSTLLHEGGEMTRKRPSRSPLTRSEVMARVRGANTGPEMKVRRALWAAGLRYRLHDKRLPGKPDLVFVGRRVALFVHGCFWHCHQGCPRYRVPKSRNEYWTTKLTRNRERDAKVRTALEAAGWRVVVIWECEIRDESRMIDLIKSIREG
jgi:DNA mismatch endonuclease Vsr